MATEKIAIYDNIIEIKDSVTLSELAEARKTTQPAARAMMLKYLQYEKIGMYVMIFPQTVTFHKTGRQFVKLVDFYLAL